MKECAGDERIALYEAKGIACWSGNDDQAHDSRHNSQSHGVISVASNIIPGLFRQLMDTPNQALNQSLQPLMNWLFCEPNPIAINSALIMTGAVKPVFRLPYVPLSQAQQKEGIELLSQLKESDFVGSTPKLIDETLLKFC